jgi:ABC-2 type transport system permease protein
VSPAVIGALARRSISQTFRRPQFIAPILLMPTLFLAVNTGGAQSAQALPGFPEVEGFLDFELAGAMIQASMLAGISGAVALAIDIELGFTDRLLAAPIGRAAIVFGRLTATIAMGLLLTVWFLAIGLVFGAEVQAGLPGVLVILVIVPLASLAFGSLGTALALWAGRVSVVQGVYPLVFVVVFLSSAFFPRALLSEPSLSEPSRSVADYNPMSFIAESVRDPIIGSLSAAETAKGLMGVAIVGVLGAGLSALALRHRLRVAT